MVVTAATQPMLAKAIEVLLDLGFRRREEIDYWTVPLVLVTIFAVRGASTFVTAILNERVSGGMLRELRAALFAKALSVPAAGEKDACASVVVNAIVVDAKTTTETLAIVFVTLTRDSMALVGLLGALLYLNWQLTLAALAIVPITAVIVRICSGALGRLQRQTHAMTAETAALVDETVRGIEVIRTNQAEPFERRRFEIHNLGLQTLSLRSAFASSATAPLTYFASSIALSAVVILALRSGMTVGKFSQFVTLILMLLSPLRTLGEVSGPIQRGVTAARSVFGYLDNVTEECKHIVTGSASRGEVTFDNVSYLPEGATCATVKNVSLHIAAGETVAIVGPSGSGKTTLLRAAARLCTPSAGRILIDGVSITDMSRADVRSQFSVVAQQTFLFNRSLAQNIAYGVDDIDQGRLNSAIDAAQLREFVDDLPDGAQTGVGQDGCKLSGGQRQRIALARAIYRDAPVLVLDEATSALDNASERAVQAAIATLMRGRTTLLVAHRLSTVRHAHKIVVMESGRIVEQGTHEQLLRKQGAYARLYRAQEPINASVTSTVFGSPQPAKHELLPLRA